MKNEGIGAISADQDNLSLTHDCSIGFRRYIADMKLTSITLDIAKVDINVETPTPRDAKDAYDKIMGELRKPRFAFERTFEGRRYTRRIR